MSPEASERPPDEALRAAARRLCRVVGEIHSHGWCFGTSGNFSVTLRSRPLELLITRSGRDKRRLGPDDLTVVDGDGRPVPGAVGRPSAETLVHCTVAGRGAGATLHTHSVASTLLGEHYLAAGGFTLSGYEMIKGLAGVDTHRAEVFVPVVANTQDMERLSREVAEILAARPQLRGLLIAGHGLYAWGATLEEAQRHVEVFEFLFECVARRNNFSPPPAQRR